MVFLNAITASAYGSLNKSLRQANIAGLQLATGTKFVPGAHENDTLLGVAVDLYSQGVAHAGLVQGMQTATEKNTIAVNTIDQCTEILDRMSELAGAVLDNNANSTDRAAMSSEYADLVSNLSTLAATTFNGVAIFSTSSQTIQVGLAATDTFNISAMKLTTWQSGVTNYTLWTGTSATGANAFLAALDGVAASLAAIRSIASSGLNRLELFSNVSSSISGNFLSQASEIRTVDSAKSIAEYTSAQTAVAATTAILAQANKLPQLSLSLYNNL